MNISAIITPRSIKEAMNCLLSGGMAMNGGQALIPEVRQGKYSGAPIDLIDLSFLSELKSNIEMKNNSLRLGASATISEIIGHKNVRDRTSILVEAGRNLGDLQVRNSATVGGNLCWGESRANLLIALIALSASLRIIDSSLQIKEVHLEKFFMNKISKKTNDFIVLSIDIPLVRMINQSYREFSRQKNDIALVNLALIEEENSVNGCIGGLFVTPLTFKKIERKGFIQRVLNIVKDSNLVKMKSQFADFEHRVCILEELLIKSTKKTDEHEK